MDGGGSGTSQRYTPVAADGPSYRTLNTTDTHDPANRGGQTDGVRLESGIPTTSQLLGGGLMGPGAQGGGAPFMLAGMNGGYGRREEGGLGLQNNQAAMLNGLRFSQGGETHLFVNVVARSPPNRVKRLRVDSSNMSLA